MVKDKEDSIKELIEKISAITIIQSSEQSPEDHESEISDDELQEMSMSDVLDALENKKISTKQYHRLCGTKPPEYHKVEIDEEHQKLVSLFCERHDIVLNSEFYYLGNLQREIKFALITPFGNGSTSYLGSESEQEKYKLLEDLLYRIREYNHVVEFLESIDSMPYVSLQIENQVGQR